MKEFLEQLNKVFDSRVRLGIMSLLVINEKIDYNTLKETLSVTDGNLASHLASLEKAEYILVSKSFVGRKTQTTYQCTEKGKQAFAEHLNALEMIIKGMI
ncbi:MAG: winged helix-turn-helix domain-containing protein [Bacteroidia bacterium]